MLLDIFLNKIS